jgi:hypothetical protein
VYADDVFDPAAAAGVLMAAIRESGSAAKAEAEEAFAELDLPKRELEQRVRRAQRRAERDELLASLEELAWWYRDLIAVAVEADGAVVHADRLEQLRQDAARELIVGAEAACEHVRETWKAFEEFNLSSQLALEALFVRLRRELTPTLATA